MSDDLEWESLQRSLLIGTPIRCRVTGHRSFGVFVAIPDVPFEGLILIPDFKDKPERMTPEEYPPVGSEITAVVLCFGNGSQKQVGLGVKPSQLLKAADPRARQPAQEVIELGAELDADGTLRFLGIDEINDRIQQGGRVIRVLGGKPAYAAVDGKPHFSGFSVRIYIQPKLPEGMIGFAP